MKTYKELYTRINQEIDVLNLHGKPDELYEPIRYMLALGGKRLRPVLVLMATDMFDGDINKAIHAALAVEVFHNFTLVHDDIMDKADLRRGMLTVHKKWDETIAILSGDLMMIKAIDLLCETPTSHLKHLIQQFNKSAAEVCEGQQWDMNYESVKEISEQDYITMITLKTAVLLGCSLKLGAIIANANTEDAENIYAFGKNIGIAFQIQDDILDSFGQSNKVGKKIGGDILANKKTILLITAMASVDKNDEQILNKWLATNDPNKANEKVNEVLNLYKKYNVLQHAESVKEKYLRLAFEHLNKLTIQPEKTTVVKQTALELMDRMS